MAAEVKKEIELEIAHVLFLDIVGYSKLSVDEQHAQVEELNEIVRLCEQFRKAEAASRLLKIPTGDGMALVFYKSPEEPAQCAVEISRALKDNARLQVRMGIHSGPVSGVVDVNERTNVAGAGVNMAQRVMYCGDAGHILLSHHVAEDLAEYERWRPFLHDIGSFEVKHGVLVSVTNLGGGWESATAEQTAGGHETSRPCTLGGDWRCTPRAGSNYCRSLLLCASSDYLSVACPRQKHRGASV